MTRYFVIPATPAAPKRFAVVCRGAVVEVLASRPDGEEIERPAGVAWRIKPPDFQSVTTLQFRFNSGGRPTRK